MRCRPKFVSDAHWLDAELPPPSHFIAGPMQVAMMRAAQRHREFIADLEAKASGLGKAQVMSVRWLAAANHTGLCGDKLAVTLVAPPPRFRRHGIIFKISAVMSAAGDGNEPAGLDLSCRQGRGRPIAGRRCVLPTSGQPRQAVSNLERA